MNATHLRRGFTLIELMVVLSIICVVMGLTLCAVQRVRNDAIRLQCGNNLRQIGLGLHMYHDSNFRLPAGMSDEPPSQPYPLLGWPARLLPFVEQDNLWRLTTEAFQINRNPFQNPPHVGLATVVPLYLCPADGRISYPQESRGYTVAFTSYLGVEGTDLLSRDGMLFYDYNVSFSEVTDGLSNTVMVGERPPSADFYYGWWYTGAGQSGSGSLDMTLGVSEINRYRRAEFRRCLPGPYSFGPGNLRNDCDLFHFWSLHPGGANFLCADGSVHFLSYSAASVLPALGTRAGGEVVELPY
jgi:prepilin-type N-terminal cleavage/methylation domain-containing protein/prepilin-type processing-associated H-X9-DG protein